MFRGMCKVLPLCGLVHAIRTDVKGHGNIGVQASQTNKTLMHQGLVAIIANYSTVKDTVSCRQDAERHSQTYY